MRLLWLEHPIDAVCPVCGEAGPKDALLSTAHVLAGRPPVTLLACAGCGAAFLADPTPPDYEREVAVMLDYYVEQGAGIDLLVAPLLRLPAGTLRRCLEVGGSAGFALDFARFTFSWEVLEVDPSPLASAGAAALGFPVRRAYFDDGLDLGPEPFDLVLCSEVLEHLAEPHALLAAIRSRLTPEGLLLLSTPNRALVHPAAEPEALGRALSPGFHLVLYRADTLARVLERAGFAAVRIEESAETLRAFAAVSATGLERLRPADPAAGQALLRAYFDSRAESSAGGSAFACGFAYRHFKECVNAGLHAEAAASRRRLAAVYRDRFGLDLDRPDLSGGRLLPFNLAGALFFSGILELNHHGRPDRAAEAFAAAVAAGNALQGGQNPFGLRDGETTELTAQSRKHLPMALAATAPERAVREIETLAAAPAGEGLSGRLFAEARAQTFIRLVNAGAYEAAERLAAAILRQVDEAAAEGPPAEAGAETLDALYCLGMLALQRGRPGEAAGHFARVHRLAGGRTEISWSARYHEGLSLGRAGRGAEAREALAEVAGGAAGKAAGSGGGAPSDRPHLPIPPALAESARALLARVEG